MAKWLKTKKTRKTQPGISLYKRRPTTPRCVYNLTVNKNQHQQQQQWGKTCFELNTKQLYNHLILCYNNIVCVRWCTTPSPRRRWRLLRFSSWTNKHTFFPYPWSLKIWRNKIKKKKNVTKYIQSYNYSIGSSSSLRHTLRIAHTVEPPLRVIASRRCFDGFFLCAAL